MSAKDSDKTQWSDPKDYGLPYVEIKPIRSKAKTAEKEAEPVIPAAESPVDSKPLALIPEREQPVVRTTESEKKELPKTEKRSISPQENRALPQKKSSSWVWAVVLIGLGIVSVIVWQIQAQLDSTSPKSEVEKEVPAVTESQETSPSITPESTPSEQNQAVVNQDSITDINNSNPNISKPAETGTTIANTAIGNLIRVESKAERPQYFIIVGSLPNEQLAIEVANQYFGRTSEIYLILPYGGGTNYRLALAKFGSFKTAAEELEKIKSQYTEALWILKY